MTFDGMWSAIEPVGRHAETGGYRRYAWTRDDATMREWFAGEAAARGLDLVTDRAGNQWAWWGDPDAAVVAGRLGVVVGSHLDSVPDGGAFDGPLGVVSALAVIDVLRERGFAPSRPIAVASLTRSQLLPDVPTMTEAGVAGFETVGLAAILAPSGTPPAIVDKVAREVAAILRMPDVRAQLEAMGLEIVASPPAEFAAYIDGESRKWGKLIKDAKVTVD